MKGAFGGGFSIIGIPLLSIVMDPVTAGGLLAPLFIVMDLFALRYWKPSTRSKPDLVLLVPGVVVGIGLGYLYLLFRFLGPSRHREKRALLGRHAVRMAPPSSPAVRRRQGTDRPTKNHSLPIKSPDSKYLIDAPAFSEHHGREWPTNKTRDIYLSAINLQRSPFNTSDMRLFPRSMEASGGLQKRC
jgi:hypothetical protein